MPIQCDEFIRSSAVPDTGLFADVQREKWGARRLIKKGCVSHVTYCVQDVDDEVLNASSYFQDLVEREHVEYHF